MKSVDISNKNKLEMTNDCSQPKLLINKDFEQIIQIYKFLLREFIYLLSLNLSMKYGRTLLVNFSINSFSSGLVLWVNT